LAYQPSKPSGAVSGMTSNSGASALTSTCSVYSPTHIRIEEQIDSPELAEHCEVLDELAHG
jgi:hypothetical protein